MCSCRSFTDQVTVELPHLGKLSFELLHTLGFDSTRKRMSVVVKHPLTEQITVYTKGADSVIMDLIRPATGMLTWMSTLFPHFFLGFNILAALMHNTDALQCIFNNEVYMLTVTQVWVMSQSQCPFHIRLCLYVYLHVLSFERLCHGVGKMHLFDPK